MPDMHGQQYQPRLRPMTSWQQNSLELAALILCTKARPDIRCSASWSSLSFEPLRFSIGGWYPPLNMHLTIVLFSYSTKPWMESQALKPRSHWRRDSNDHRRLRFTGERHVRTGLSIMLTWYNTHARTYHITAKLFIFWSLEMQQNGML